MLELATYYVLRPAGRELHRQAYGLLYSAMEIIKVEVQGIHAIIGPIGTHNTAPIRPFYSRNIASLLQGLVRGQIVHLYHIVKPRLDR